MAVTKLSSVVGRVKTTLHETTPDGTRWKNSELVEWVNEAYQAIVQIKPDASTINKQVQLIAGTRQVIPLDGMRLIDVIRCTSPESDGEGISVYSRKQMDVARRSWHREPQTVDIEHYMFDELDPKTFYVYPPAAPGTQIEIVYSSIPGPHDSSSDTVPDDVIRMDDSYAPVIVDYCLYRAYSKDAEHQANLNRSQMHYNSLLRSLGQKVQVDIAISPNQQQA